MNNEIYEFIRSRKGRKTVRNAQGQPRRIGGEKIGVVLATVIDLTKSPAPLRRKIVFGWSQVNRKAGDFFDKNAALGLARQRAFKGTNPEVKMPNEVAKVQARLATRSAAYFKGATL
jgi:hypothetical protein